MTNNLFNLLILTPSGWKRSNEINEGDVVYGLTESRTIAPVEVRTIDDSVGMLYRFTGANGLFEGYGAYDTGIYTVKDHTVALGSLQYEGLELLERPLGFVYTNFPSFRIVLPTRFDLIPNTSKLSYTEYGSRIADMVKFKHTGLDAQSLSKELSIQFIKTWYQKYFDLIVEDDSMAMDIQHILMRCGIMSYVEKTYSGRMVVRGYDSFIHVTDVRTFDKKSHILRFFDKDDKPLHLVCRTPTQKVFVA